MTTRVDEMCCSKTVGTVCITQHADFVKKVDQELTKVKLNKMYDTLFTWAYAYTRESNLRRKSYPILENNPKDYIPHSDYHYDWETNLPSCVKWFIRRRFNEKSGLYTGYFPKSGWNSRSYSCFQTLCTISKWMIGMNLYCTILLIYLEQSTFFAS